MLDTSLSRAFSNEEANVKLANDRSADVPLLVQYWRIIARRRLLVLAIISTTLVVGLVATLLITPRYTAVATVEIARQESRVVNMEGVQPETQPLDQEFYQTQYSLLKARSLAERIVGRLRLDESSRLFEGLGNNLPARLKPVAAGRPLTPDQRDARRKLAVDLLLANVTITPVRQSRLVELGFTSRDPRLSTDIANAWTVNFISQNLDRRFEATAYARRFLEERLEQLRQRLEASEAQLVNYATKQRIINLPQGQTSNGERLPERSIAVDDLTALNTALATARSERIATEARVRSGGANTDALSDTVISSLRQRRAEASAEYAKLLVQFEPGYPPARALASQIAQLDQAITHEEGRVRKSASGSLEAARGREAGLQKQVDGLKGDLLDQRTRSIQYNIFQRDVDTTRQLYDALLQRYKEIGVAGGIGTNNVSIVDAARLPEQPSSPKLWLNMLIAFLLGLAGAVAAVLALENSDEALRDPSQVGKELGLPLLGSVPLVVDTDPISALEDRKSALVDAYLSVQAALRFSTDHGMPRSLAFTSTRPAEGKSTSALALALTVARAGRKVVLVDGDMRAPSMHSMLNLSNEAGLSSFLAGEDDVDRLISHVERFEIDVITSGVTPPNAAELLSGPRFHELVERLQQRYDHVFIDMPPVLGLADAPLIAGAVEGVCYIVEAGGVSASVVRSSLARLVNADAHLLGVVVTRFTPEKGYGTDYAYGYGYGYGNDKK